MAGVVSTSPWPSKHRSRRSSGNRDLGRPRRRPGYRGWSFCCREDDSTAISSRSLSSTPRRRQASTDRGESREKHPSLPSKGAAAIPTDDGTDAALVASFLSSAPINNGMIRTSTRVPLTQDETPAVYYPRLILVNVEHTPSLHFHHHRQNITLTSFELLFFSPAPPGCYAGMCKTE